MSTPAAHLHAAPADREVAMAGAAAAAAGRDAATAGAGPAGLGSSTPGAAGQIDATAVLRDSFRGLIVALRRVRGRETHHPGELSFAQYSLLSSLSKAKALSSREIAQQADLSPATVTQMLEALEAQSLVTRRRTAEDRRVVWNALTPRGRELLAARRARMEPGFRAAVAEFTPAELQRAAQILDRIAEYFNALDC